MQKLSPLMKGLVETRARADAECLRLSLLIENLTTQLAKATSERNSCDQLISRINNQIQPSQIEPINAWQNRYGKRGTLKQTIITTLKNAYPNILSTSQICSSLQSKFNLAFNTPSERKDWVSNSIGNLLNKLARAQKILRLHNPTINSGQPGLWQWIPNNQENSNLQTLAAHAGLTTVGALGIEDLELEPAPEEDDLPR